MSMSDGLTPTSLDVSAGAERSSVPVNVPDRAVETTPRVDVRLTAAPDADAAGERRRPDTPRRELDRRVASVLESVTHAFLALDPEWRITYANREAARLNGTTAEELVGRDHWTVWPETRGSELERRYREAAAARVPQHFVHHYPVADVWHEVHAYPCEDGGVAVLFRDISDERRASLERDRLAGAFAAQQRELAAILEHVTDIVVRIDAADRLTYANPAFAAATGHAVDGAVGQRFDALNFPPPLVERWREAVARIRARGVGEVLTFDLELRRGLRVFEMRGIPMTDAAGPHGASHGAPHGGAGQGDAGRVDAVLVVVRDVTERVAAERTLAAALANAQAAARAKSEYLATVGHELRTPLNAIRGYAVLLGDETHGPVSAAQRQFLDRILASERHLLGLIGDVLDFARLEAARVSYAVEPTALAEVVAEAASFVTPQARAKGLALDVRVCDAVIGTDAKKLRQIVLNLLTNAVKFTPAGGEVALRCAAVPTGALVEVRDTGPGIAPADQERIFEPFVQLDRAAAGPVGGMGLGLAISRSFARDMGGDLTVESAPGRGTTFRLTLPTAGARDPVFDTPPAGTAHGAPPN